MFQFAFALDKKCIVNPQIPAGIEVKLGTPLFVAKLAIMALSLWANVT
jgi:hypothetical protein